MRKRIDPNRKITQVADPEFYRGLPLINSPKWCRRLKAVNR